MQISEEDSIFLEKIVRDFWKSEYLDGIPNVDKKEMKGYIERGAIKYVILLIPEWCLYRYLNDRRYTVKLITRKRQLIIKDDYGNIDYRTWNSELEKFVTHRMSDLVGAFTSFPDYCLDIAKSHSCEEYLKYRDEEQIVRLIERLTEKLEWQGQDEKQNPETPADGYEFEIYVSKILQSNGWEVRHTGKSGDQGADLLAEKDSRKYVIQCKFSSYPVGNSAVQEAHSGRGYHGAKFAAVVTNSDFTRSARQLAAAVGVDLLNSTELEDL